MPYRCSASKPKLSDALREEPAPSVGIESETAVSLPKPDAFERRFVLYCIVIALILASLPCAIGFALSRPDWQFVGAAYNIDDTMVYFAWTRQAADGHFFIRNLFTTEPQIPIQFNLLILMLGAIVRVTGLSIPVVFFAARIIASAFLLVLIYRLFLAMAPNDAWTRMCAMAFVSMGSGFGWLFWPQWSDNNAHSTHLPVDTWQPEALTFQSIEMSTLFAFGLILIVATFLLLILGLRSGRMRYAVGAGLCALVLGNVHSYDIVHVAAGWLFFLIALTILDRKLAGRAWLQGVVCAAIALPSVLYQYHMYIVDPAFHQRAHDPTYSDALVFYLLGWGIVFVMGAAASIAWFATRFRAVTAQLFDRNTALIAMCWFLGGLVVSYTPHLDFQRKMIMGADIPISLLGACGVAMAAKLAPPRLKSAVFCAFILLSLPTSILFVTRDIHHLGEDQSETLMKPFMSADEVSALQWIRDNTSPDSAILGFPQLTCFVPAWCDRYTYVSHWGETPNYNQKLGGFVQFTQTGMSIQDRIAYLVGTKTDYFVFPNVYNGVVEPGKDGRYVQFENFNQFPDILSPVYSNKELTIYKILLLHPPK
jgi:arabinosyltransferase C